jgi:hypothetical protein
VKPGLAGDHAVAALLTEDDFIIRPGVVGEAAITSGDRRGRTRLVATSERMPHAPLVIRGKRIPTLAVVQSRLWAPFFSGSI